MDTLWQLYDVWATNIGNDVKSEAKAYQQVATTIAQNAPWTWDVWDAYALATGKDLYSGEDVSGWNRALTAAAIFIPWVSGGEMRAGKDAIKTSLWQMKLSEHAMMRMEQRWISKATIQNTVNQWEKFSYKNDKWQMLTWFYDATKQIFVWKWDSITTVINKVSRNYINNLKATLWKK